VARLGTPRNQEGPALSRRRRRGPASRATDRDDAPEQARNDRPGREEAMDDDGRGHALRTVRARNFPLGMASPTGTGLNYQPVFRGEFVIGNRAA